MLGHGHTPFPTTGSTGRAASLRGARQLLTHGRSDSNASCTAAHATPTDTSSGLTSPEHLLPPGRHLVPEPPKNSGCFRVSALPSRPESDVGSSVGALSPGLNERCNFCGGLHGLLMRPHAH